MCIVCFVCRLPGSFESTWRQFIPQSQISTITSNPSIFLISSFNEHFPSNSPFSNFLFHTTTQLTHPPSANHPPHQLTQQPFTSALVSQSDLAIMMESQPVATHLLVVTALCLDQSALVMSMSMQHFQFR